MSDDKAESNGPREFWIPKSNLDFYFRDNIILAQVTGANIRMSDNVVPADAIFFIERCHYDALAAQYEELLSYLPKVPTQPYEKQLAKDLEEMKVRAEKAEQEWKWWNKHAQALENRIEALRAGLEHLAEPHKIHDKEWTCTIDARAALAADDAAKEKP